MTDYEIMRPPTTNPNIKDDRPISEILGPGRKMFAHAPIKTYEEVLKELFGLEGQKLIEAIYLQLLQVKRSGHWFETLYIDDLKKRCDTGKTFRYEPDDSLTAVYGY